MSSSSPTPISRSSTCGICYDEVKTPQPLHEDLGTACFEGTVPLHRAQNDSQTTTAPHSEPFACCGPCSVAFVITCIRSRDLRSLVCPSPSCREPLTSKDVERILLAPSSNLSDSLQLLPPPLPQQQQGCDPQQRTPQQHEEEKNLDAPDTLPRSRDSRRGHTALFHSLRQTEGKDPFSDQSRSSEGEDSKQQGISVMKENSREDKGDVNLNQEKGGGEEQNKIATQPLAPLFQDFEEGGEDDGTRTEEEGEGGGHEGGAQRYLSIYYEALEDRQAAERLKNERLARRRPPAQQQQRQQQGQSSASMTVGGGGEEEGGGSAHCLRVQVQAQVALACWTALDSLEFQFWRLGADAKRCPGCQVLIEKNGGCSHMTCRSCNHEFRWCCGQDYKSAHNEYLCLPNKLVNHPSPLWGPVPPVRAVTKTTVGVAGVGVGLAGATVAAAAAVGLVAGGVALAIPVGVPVYVAGRVGGVGPLAPPEAPVDAAVLKATMEDRNEKIRNAIRAKTEWN